jgi:hypothetical protein
MTRNYGIRPVYEPPPERAPLWRTMLNLMIGAAALLTVIGTAFLVAHLLHAVVLP